MTSFSVCWTKFTEFYYAIVYSYYLLLERAVSPQGIFVTLLVGAILFVMLIHSLLCMRQLLWDFNSNFLYRLTDKHLEWRYISQVVLRDVDFELEYTTHNLQSKLLPRLNAGWDYIFKYSLRSSIRIMITLFVLFAFVLFLHFIYFHADAFKSKLTLDFTFAAFILFITVVTQVYLKTRAEEKLRWLKTLEVELNRYFAFLTSEREGNFMSEKYEETTRCDPYSVEKKTYYVSRFKLTSKLELLLDPSKKEHRALVALMHHVIGVNQIQMDHVILKKLGFIRRNIEGTYKSDLDIFDHEASCRNKKEIMTRYVHEYRISRASKPPLNETEWLTADKYDLISMIFRLAQFIMGREKYNARLIL